MLFDFVYLGDMMDVRLGESVFFRHVLHGTITIILHQVYLAQLIKVCLGIVEDSVFLFCWDAVAVSIGVDGSRLHAVHLKHLFRGEPFRDGGNVNG